MRIEFVEIQNFRKLKSCRVDFAEKETVFVGANNSGKTSAMDALMFFLKFKGSFSAKEFTLSNWKDINEIGKLWISKPSPETTDLDLDKWLDYLPTLDVWLRVETSEIHYVNHLIPTLGWSGGLLGVRLRVQPKNVEELYQDFNSSYIAANGVTEKAAKTNKKTPLKLWPKTMWDFLERRLHTHFEIQAFILDPSKLSDPLNGVANPQAIPDATQLEKAPFEGLIRIDIINAQRGFSDPSSESIGAPKAIGNLSTQLRDYYSKHLNPFEQPTPEDIDALQSIESARDSFDDKLKQSFTSSLQELEDLNYPGFGNPGISISSKISAIDGLDHDSSVQFNLLKSETSTDYPLSLPERYNGLGYQNLISMMFKLIRFRDDWMQVGKSLKPSIEGEVEFEPLHLVLIEEPEAHLHAQVQQVFIRKAYDVLRKHKDLGAKKQFSTQLVVSTHSSHVAHESEFTSLRYFRRKAAEAGKVSTSVVVNLSKTFGASDKTTKFAIRYLKTTHCDLFFADATILIEGPAERMLIPHFIKHHFKELGTCYISLLEIGGSHAHKLKPLIEDLGIICLIITDLDSIETTGKSSVQPEKGKDYETGNDTLKSWIPIKNKLDDVLALIEIDKESKTQPTKVSYQCALTVNFGASAHEVIPYTFEDALVFENIDLFKGLEGQGLIKKFKEALNKATIQEASKAMYDALMKNAKKAEFALDLLYLEDPEKLKVPTYIAQGLEWLKEKLKTKQADFTPKN